MRTLVFLAVFSTLACQSRNHDEVEPKSDDRLEALEEKFEALKIGTVLDLDAETGWPSKFDCDGLLWAGKAASVGLPVKVDLAEYSPGELHRRPPPSCWNEKDGDVGSKSTISNDMILGWLWAKWSLGDLDALKRLAKYGEDRNWFMGLPKSMMARVYLKPNQQGLLGRMIFSLSKGADGRSYRHLFESYPSVTEDYARHLQALGILLQGLVEMDDLEVRLIDINDQMLQRLHELVDVEPKNALFQAALGRYTGDYDAAYALLLDDSTPVPTYVRGDKPEVLAKVERLFAMMVVIQANHDEYP